MFQNDDLKTILEYSTTIGGNSLIIGEWNLNYPENISQIGNYRYRPTEETSLYKIIPTTYDINDAGNFYTNATDSDVTIDGGYDDLNEPQIFTSLKEKEKQLFSLESCFDKFRPRSGINKLRYFNNKNVHHINPYISYRPRYYVSDRNDYFKYWTSYRNENGIERGVAKKIVNSLNRIDDAAPFVVYKKDIPANRITIKMQTNVGTKDLGPFSNSSGIFSDPFYGYSNQTTPTVWKVQTLVDNNWVDAINFNQNSKRRDGSNVIQPDGHVELEYGLSVPSKYIESYAFRGKVTSEESLPTGGLAFGHAFLLVSSGNDIGLLKIWNGSSWESYVPSYQWKLNENNIDESTNLISSLVSTPQFFDNNTKQFKYREFEKIRGLRIVVDTMNKFDSTFDLIELSPRLLVNLTDRTTEFSVSKIASDLGNSGLPVGQLLASTGSLTMFDFDQAFNINNELSILSTILNKNIKINFYEVIDSGNGLNYHIPIKTLYADNIPKTSVSERTTTLELRDLYFYFESIAAPSLFLTNASLTFIVSTLLDSIGFSNYTFKQNEKETELVVPFFYSSPEKTVAEVLNSLAISSQTSMFFDEANNFILMSKNYMMPTKEERSTDLVLYGSNDENTNKQPNIINIASVDKKVYNDGKINYTSRYIQKSVGSIQQASMIDKEKSWVYKPVLLWEVSGTQNTKTSNDSVGSMSDYVLSAIPLNSDLSSLVPTVLNNQILNNVIDLGEGVYWITRYNGYFYSNGEVVKYDAVEYSIPKIGNVWINSTEEYERYFSSLSFNGKIYPTGLIRIYSEPDYETVNGVLKLKNGEISKHGRGQFGTSIVSHSAGINKYWSSDDNVMGCNMYSEYLFTDKSLDKTVIVDSAGVDLDTAKKMTRSGIIKNFMVNSYSSEYENKSISATQSGTIQSSALVLTGPTFKTEQNPIDYINYVYKPLTNKFKHFGTRLRIIGKVENNSVRGQTPIGSMTYFVQPAADSSENLSIGGGSGGLGVMINPKTNVGYYFEVIALTDSNAKNYASGSKISNLMFYKIGKDSVTSKAVPVSLWSGSSNIIVDDGNFTGQYRMAGEANPTVYDLAVEYMDVGSIRKFYLYLNNTIVATVIDEEPLPVYNNMCLFSRGSSKLMFENLFAITNNYSQNSAYSIDTPFNQIFDNQEITSNEAFRKYAMSSVVQSTYLSGISPSQPPPYNIYFEEFGSIMRECSYFNIKYDKAYPALAAKISPTFNQIKGYTISGFQANPYGAEFLIFNATDSALSLDATSGNYLRIQGIAFTQSTTHSLSVDDYYAETSSPSTPQYTNKEALVSTKEAGDKFNEIKLSRSTYGNTQFTLDLEYIQTQDDANSLMGWLMKKIIKPRKSIGVDIFSMPIVQLGDIVQIYYKDNSGLDIVAKPDERFVVYNISYSRNATGPNMSLFLSEITDD